MVKMFEPNPFGNVVIPPLKFILYGVDLLENQQIINKYRDADVFVERINPSHCYL